jgi:hypothetical protein
MSSVNTVVIQIGYGDEEKAIEAINNYLKEDGRLGNPFVPIKSSESAGTKSPEKTLLWGGINYLNVQEFIDLFLSLDIVDSLMTIFNSDGDHCYVVSKDVVVDTIHEKREMY